MLQKTKAENVVVIYKKFINKYPNTHLISLASFDELKDIMEPIGLSSQRAKKMLELSKVLVERYDGKIPSSKEALLELPGIGMYIANAVLCFAFNCDVGLLDTNIGRIIERVFSLKVSGEERKKLIAWEAISQFVPKGKAKRFNYSLIDFGASICIARNPKHHLCPLVDICDCRLNIKYYL